MKPAIVSDPEIMNGALCFRGTRVPFKNLIDYLEGGHSLGEFVRQFPSVPGEMAIQTLEEAKESLFARIGGPGAASPTETQVGPVNTQGTEGKGLPQVIRTVLANVQV